VIVFISWTVSLKLHSITMKAINIERALWHTRRHFGHTGAEQFSFPVGSARAWLSDTNVPPERLSLSNARRVVVKVGTAVVSNPDGTLALSRLGALVEQVISTLFMGQSECIIELFLSFSVSLLMHARALGLFTSPVVFLPRSIPCACVSSPYCSDWRL